MTHKLIRWGDDKHPDGNTDGHLPLFYDVLYKVILFLIFFPIRNTKAGTVSGSAFVVPEGPKKSPPEDSPPSPTGTATLWVVPAPPVAQGWCPRCGSRRPGRHAEPVTRCDRHSIPNVPSV